LNDLKKHDYELRIKRSEDSLNLDLYELPPNGSKEGTHSRLVSYLKEENLAVVQGALSRILKENSHSFSEIRAGRKSPFRINEEEGVRLDLIFRSVVGIKKRTRMEDIVLGIETMPREESYYWHAKVSKGTEKERSNGLKALRMLLGGE
jgi:hypothetical protein